MLDIKYSRLLAAFFLFCSVAFASSANFILENDDILNEKVANKIEQIGTELFEKTQISVYLITKKTINEANLYKYFQSQKTNFKQPFAVLILIQNKHMLNIYSSDDVSKLFDKEAILSPYPSTGTIIPLLTGKKDNDNYNAALLNGYADLAEQIAKSKNIILENALGNSNKIILKIVRYLLYGSIMFIVFILIYRRFFRGK